MLDEAIYLEGEAMVLDRETLLSDEREKQALDRSKGTSIYRKPPLKLMQWVTPVIIRT